jgi:hypothetical protein
MAKDVINVDGKELVVREDTAKAYRFVVWGVVTAAIGLSLMMVLFFAFFWTSVNDGTVGSPVDGQNSNVR